MLLKERVYPTELVNGVLACFKEPRDTVGYRVAADLAADHECESLEKLLRWMAEVPTDWQLAKTIVTGSRVYGKVKPESDIDVVFDIYCHQLNELRLFCDEDSSKGKCKDYEYNTSGMACALRFGPVNLLCITTRNQLRAWQKGTEQLVTEALHSKQGYVTRERAIEVFTWWRRETGCVERPWQDEMMEAYYRDVDNEWFGHDGIR